MSAVHEATEGRVRVLTLVNEGKLNAFDPPMLSALADAIRRADADATVGVIVLTGQGRAFCAGGDVSAMGEVADAEAHQRYLTEQIHAVPRALRGARTPTIAMINGVAVGAGLDIALACDLRTCSTEAHLAEGYINAGLAAGDGGAWLLPRLAGPGRALELLLTGRKITPDEALAYGLVNRLAPPDRLREETLSLAESLASRPPAAAAAMKRLVYQSLEVSFDVGLQLAASAVSVLQSGDEHRQAVQALRDRSARAKGAAR